MVAGCRVAQVGALHAQSHAEGHPACLLSNRSPAHQVLSQTAPGGARLGTTQGQWLCDDHLPALQAGKGSEHQSRKGAFAPGGQQDALELPKRAFVPQLWPRWHLLVFFRSVLLSRCSELQQQRATEPPTQLIVLLEEVASPGHTGAQRAFQPESD